MIKNKNLKMISNRLDELITSDFISFNKDNMFKDMELCIDVPKMYYEINTGSLDGFNINNIEKIHYNVQFKVEKINKDFINVGFYLLILYNISLSYLF